MLRALIKIETWGVRRRPSPPHPEVRLSNDKGHFRANSLSGARRAVESIYYTHVQPEAKYNCIGVTNTTAILGLLGSCLRTYTALLTATPAPSAANTTRGAPSGQRPTIPAADTVPACMQALRCPEMYAPRQLSYSSQEATPTLPIQYECTTRAQTQTTSPLDRQGRSRDTPSCAITKRDSRTLNLP